MNPESDFSEIHRVAVQTAQKAGEYLVRHFGKIKPDQVDDKGINDFVTFVDRHSEEIIVSEIQDNFKDHSILAEEKGIHSEGNAFRWIIDPLDGTKNFIQTLPYFCVSIAVEYQGQIVVGVVHDPIHRETFHAISGQGSYLNEQKINVSQETNIQRTMICTGFPHRDKWRLPAYLKAFEEIFLICTGIRRMGAAALDLCYTACGRFAGFWEFGLSSWDMAAGSVIIQEASGQITDFWGNPDFLNNGYVVAGNKIVHNALKSILEIHFQKPESNI